MKRTRSSTLLAALATLGATALALVNTGISHAELPPTAYLSAQTKAPEAVTLRIGEVTDDGNGSITVVATVTKVARTATGLKPGDAIRLVYQTHVNKPGEPMIVGPSPVPVPIKGQTTPAFLQRHGTTYEPAAGGMTFNPLTREEFASEDVTLRFTDLAIANDDVVHAHARVVSVTNSQAGLKADDAIAIDFNPDGAEPNSGPGPIDLRQTYHALLARFTTETAFHPSLCVRPARSCRPHDPARLAGRPLTAPDRRTRATRRSADEDERTVRTCGTEADASASPQARTVTGKPHAAKMSRLGNDATQSGA